MARSDKPNRRPNEENLVADDSKPSNPGPFDVRTVKNLVSLMASHDLAEIDLRDGMQRLRIRRGGQHTVVSHSHAPMPAPVSHAPPPTVTTTPDSAAPPAAAAAAAKSGKKLLEIKSESVGTFYAKSSPDVPTPYVSVGSKVAPNTVVGQVEAMKIFNEIHAGVSGTIVEVLVENQQFIEFGQVLFRVE